MTDAVNVPREVVMAALNRVLPVSYRDGPDYAELTFGESQTKAMTLEPETWMALNDIPDLLAAAPKAEPVSDPYKLAPWEEGREEGRLADRAWRVGDPKPAVGSMVLISGVHGDIESDQHRAYLWRRVVGYGVDSVDFICLQTKGCWPTVERLDNCWFADTPHQPLSNPQQLPEAPKVEQETVVSCRNCGTVRGGTNECDCSLHDGSAPEWDAAHPAPASDELLTVIIELVEHFERVDGDAEHKALIEKATKLYAKHKGPQS